VQWAERFAGFVDNQFVKIHRFGSHALIHIVIGAFSRNELYNLHFLIRTFLRAWALKIFSAIGSLRLAGTLHVSLAAR